MDTLMKIKKFISFWYMRYLLATELYMVQPWEKAVVHVTMGAFFILTWYFNYAIVMNTVSQFRNAAGNIVEKI